MKNPRARRPWFWIPSLYFAEGLPYALVMTVSVVMYKRLGLSNTDVALYTSWLNLPWVIKPLWSPLVGLLRTRRGWIWPMQLLVGAALAGVALTLPTTAFVQWTMVCLFLVAFSSATHDIAADGFYMLALPEREQAWFSGLRNTFYRIANITGQGLLVMLAGKIQQRTGNEVLAWQFIFGGAGAWMILLAGYHWLVLPRPSADRAGKPSAVNSLVHEFLATFESFFRKPGVGRVLTFLLLYRFAEAQLGKAAQLFMLESRERGGLGLATTDVGFLYGTVGVVALLLGGILGGWAVARRGLKFWLWPMALAINVPDAVYVYLAHAQPDNLALVGGCVAVEQFGYGFGFAAYMLYMIYAARGEHRTAHYAICTGFMALGVMLPGMWSGWLLDKIGYINFFWWVMLATIPSFLVVKLIPLDAEFGREHSDG